MLQDDEEDNHLCIKCNATIIGLANYVQHRKEKCPKLKYPPSLKVSQHNLEAMGPTRSLGADVFFQSLELQSSSKKVSQSSPTPLMLNEKMTPTLQKPTITSAATERAPRISPLDHSLRGEDWIGGHSLKITSNEDNQTKLIKAVANISGTAKKEIPTTSYDRITPYDYKNDEQSDDTTEESDDEDEDDVHESGGKWKPPSNYTGGKWKPEGVLPWRTPEHDDWDVGEEHTGGKWKPISMDNTSKNDDYRDDDYDAPPPGHTKGKWVPGANERSHIMQPTIQTKGSVQYWCGPCNRRLSSRIVYEKHLMSNLHLRKMIPENDLEFSGHMDTPKILPEKRIVKPSQYVNNTMYSSNKKTLVKRKTKLSEVVQSKDKKKRNRKPLFVSCTGCKSRVRSHLMGKHLISHYHVRKANISGSEYEKLVLDNIEAMVHQSPFQCGPCKFYANWIPNFMQHWLSKEHEEKISAYNDNFWCSFCKFECKTSKEMLDHMMGSPHQDIVALINRSMPIIMRRKSVISCPTCGANFRYNIEAKKHSKSTGHSLPLTAMEKYQEVIGCNFCPSRFKTTLALAAHLKIKHSQDPYLCILCSLSFKSADEVKIHRHSTAHRVKRKEKLRERGVKVTGLKKKCPHCVDERVLENVLELKEHIKLEHPDIKRKCPKCGMEFILHQEVANHIKAKACDFRHSNAVPESSHSIWECDHCPYRTSSQAEYIFHETLHKTPETKVISCYDTTKTIETYECPICQKQFQKASLRQHLKQHTFEMTFRCVYCSKSFARKSSLANHIKKCHGKDKSGQVLKKKHVCSVCHISFASSESLRNHKVSIHDESSESLDIESRLCSHPKCVFTAKTKTQLTRHQQSHKEKLLRHKCDQCEFKASQSSHLKRHKLCHEEVKPYQCPHCNFACRSLENLRKHVLKSKKHPGLPLYECMECKGDRFSTNFASQLRVHLMTSHEKLYDKRKAVEAVSMYCKKIILRPEVNKEMPDPREVTQMQVEETLSDGVHWQGCEQYSVILFKDITDS